MGKIIHTPLFRVASINLKKESQIIECITYGEVKKAKMIRPGVAYTVVVAAYYSRKRVFGVVLIHCGLVTQQTRKSKTSDVSSPSASLGTMSVVHGAFTSLEAVSAVIHLPF